MKEIKCPHCGKQFTVDESGYQQIVSQIKDEQFNVELKSRLEALKQQFAAESKVEKAQSEKDINALKSTITELNLTIETLRKDKEAEITKATSSKNEENVRLAQELKAANERIEENLKNYEKETKTQIALAEAKAKEKAQEEINLLKSEKQKLEFDIKDANNNKELEIKALNEKHALEIKGKEDQIAYYKDLKTKMSTKLVGETLEQHCKILFDQIRMTAFKDAYFEKDNDDKAGSKGDFIFKDFIDENKEHPYISIMFEMKNENDTTATKHKNEDFLEKLDKDRTEKGCEYAVLVSMLEQENELYNSGIVDVSYKYPKMYVIRPQCFIAMITLLRNAALNSLQYQKELIVMKSQNVDIEHFEENLRAAQDGFQYNYELANKKFVDAIERIDSTITNLTKIKEALLGTDNNLRIANRKLHDISIKSLTKNSPSLKEKFDELKKDN